MANDSKLSAAALRETAMSRLIAGNAPIDIVREIIKKLYAYDHEDFTEDQLEDDLSNYFEIHSGAGKGEKQSMQSRVEDWLSSNTSNKACYSFVTCSLPTCYSDLGIKTPQDKAACRMAFKRLVAREKLEPVRDRSGVYRILIEDEEVIDFMGADITPYPIKFPLSVHEYVSIHPGNVLIVAGESNAGKSAMCLNVAKMNCHVHPVNYMSSEMQDGAELRIRLQKFGEALENWKKIKFTFRTDDFPAKIDPDGLNIIDYLDEGTDAEAYKMPMRIRQIADRLKKGVALIALQKDPNKGLGFGGSGTLNRSRLYMTLATDGTMKIVKAKIWRNDNINPNGMFCRFKLVGGAKFIKESEWQK